MKVCTKCRVSKEITEFYKNKATLSGLDNYCKSCRTVRTGNERGRYADGMRFVNPAKILISKGNLVCVCCGNKNSEWLQIDHITSVKKHGGREVISKLTRRIVEGEIPSEWFQLLCANCNFAKADLDVCPIDHSLD